MDYKAIFNVPLMTYFLIIILSIDQLYFNLEKLLTILQLNDIFVQVELGLKENLLIFPG